MSEKQKRKTKQSPQQFVSNVKIISVVILIFFLSIGLAFTLGSNYGFERAQLDLTRTAINALADKTVATQTRIAQTQTAAAISSPQATVP